jgi:hypothetical protein
MRKLVLLSVILLSLQGFSSTKAERYAIYTAKCNVIDTMKIQESGFLKIDTLVLTTMPTKPTYYGKTITSSIKVSSTRSLIVVVDTIWSTVKVPLYAFGIPPVAKVVPDYNKDYRRWVYRTKTITIKRCKPVSYTIWTKNELYYETLLKDIETNILLTKNSN